MKEDVVAANLANLRQSINELKECVNRQNVTPNQPEQHISSLPVFFSVSVFSYIISQIQIKI